MSPISWHHLPLEVKILVMEQAVDFKSLHGLITVDPVLTKFFCESGIPLLPDILEKSLPGTTQYIVQEHFMIKQAGKRPGIPLGRLPLSRITGYRTDSYIHRGWGPAWVPLLAEYPLSILREIVQIQNAIDYFTWTFTASRCQPPEHGEESKVEAPPSPSEVNRIHQALWLFQSCCDVSSTWMSTDTWEVEYKQDTRVMRLKSYLRTFCTWELQELECIYDHLAELLERSARDPDVDAVGNRLDPYALPEPIDTIDKMQRMRAIHGAKAKLLSQGLVSLHTYIRHTPVSARKASLEKSSGSPDEFIVATLHEMNIKSCRYDLGECSDGESHVLPPKRAKTTRRPNAGWEYFLPFPRNTDDIFGITATTFDKTRTLSLRYLRQFGFCIWDSARLARWGVLHHRYGAGLDAELQRRWCGWVPRTGSWACCFVSSCPKKKDECRCRERMDPRFEPRWREVREPRVRRWCVCGCKLGHL